MRMMGKRFHASARKQPPEPALVRANQPVRCRRERLETRCREQLLCDRDGIDPERRTQPFRSLLIALEGQSHGEICSMGRRPGVPSVDRQAGIEGRAKTREQTLHPSARGQVEDRAADTGIDLIERKITRYIGQIDSESLDAPGKMCGADGQGWCSGGPRQTRVEAAACRPTGGPIEGRLDERAVDVSENPCLTTSNQGSEEAEEAASARSKIDEPGSPGQSLHQGQGKIPIAGRRIESLTQRKPVSSKSQKRPRLGPSLRCVFPDDILAVRGHAFAPGKSELERGVNTLIGSRVLVAGIRGRNFSATLAAPRCLMPSKSVA